MAYLNQFAPGMEAIDLTGTDEFESLLASAADLGIAHAPRVRYVSRNVVANGLRFHVLEWGERGNPGLLVLHGGNQTAHSWDLVSLHLADRFHVVAVDQRGHGDSEWPRDSHASPSEMASDACAVADQLGLARPVIAGHSMGGIVTLALLRDRPGFARKAVVVDVGPELSEHGTRYIRDFVGSIGEYASLEEFIDKVVSYDPFRSREHIARTARYNLLRRADGVYVSKHDQRRRLIRSISEEFLRDRPTLEDAAHLELPVLVVRGGESTVLPQDLAERFVERLQCGRLVTVDHCGHNVHSQNTAGFLAAVVPFLEEDGT
jgi:pimeloyl-ACP methyl ester carboxylesterase